MKPLNIDSLPAEQTPAAVTAEPSNSPRVEKLVSLLKPCIPPLGNRHGFYLALTGFFAKQLLPLAEAKAVVIALCEYTGTERLIGERLTLAETSYAKHAAGDVVAGLDGLVDALRHSVGAGAHTVAVNVAETITPIGGDTELETKQIRGKTSMEQSADPRLGKINQNTLAFNLQTLPEWQGVIKYDVFRQERVAVRAGPVELSAETGKWTDTDTKRIKNWFEVHQGVNPSVDTLEAALDVVAHDNEFNSVVDYLESLPKKGEAGYVDKLSRVMGLQSLIERKMLRVWLVSAVARAYKPGVFVKGAFCMQGPQNAGKTAFLRIMFGDQYRVSLNGDLADDKMIGEKLAGAWVAEIEEAHAVKRTDKDALKRFISSQYDDFRPAYGRHKIRHERTCAIAITTNQTEFLDDETGNVRFYCVRVAEKMDLREIERLRDSVWAEVRDAYKTGEPWYLTDERDQEAAAELAKNYEIVDPLEEWITEKLAGKASVSVREMIQLAAVLGSEVIANMAAKERFAERRFARALLKAGCRRRKSNGRIYYDVPAELAQAGKKTA